MKFSLSLSLGNCKISVPKSEIFSVFYLKLGLPPAETLPPLVDWPIFGPKPIQPDLVCPVFGIPEGIPNHSATSWEAAEWF